MTRTRDRTRTPSRIIPKTEGKLWTALNNNNRRRKRIPTNRTKVCSYSFSHRPDVVFIWLQSMSKNDSFVSVVFEIISLQREPAVLV